MRVSRVIVLGPGSRSPGTSGPRARGRSRYGADYPALAGVAE